MGLALGLTAIAGVTADIVSLSQILVLGGELGLMVLYPLSGIGVAIPAILVVPMVDQRPRLPMLRTLGLGTGLLYLLALGLSVPDPDSGLALVGSAIIWIAASAQNYMYPMLLWSLAGDLFNVAESREVNGWIASWSYVGRLVALALTMLSPVMLAAAGVPLVWLQLVPTVITIGTALWLPHRMRGSAASPGLPTGESARESLASGLGFVREVPIWRRMVLASTITGIAVGGVSLGTSAAAEMIVGDDAGRLQTYLSAAAVVAILGCLAVQRWLAVPLVRRIGLRGALLVLPIGIILSAVLLTVGVLAGSLVAVAAAIVFRRVPEWSIDSNARSAVLAFVPDQRRARVSLVLVLSVTVGWVTATPLAMPGLLTPATWLLGALPAVVGAAALAWWLPVYRGWDASMLDWRLRRRKRGLAVWAETSD